MAKVKVETMGRIKVEFELANYLDVRQAETGLLAPEKVRHARIAGVVDSGASRLVLPASVAAALGLPSAGQASVQYADQRKATRPMVKDACLTLFGRQGNFTAVVEPDRTDALLGAIVLEELDLIVDCPTQTLRPRDPERIVSEVE